MRKPTTTAAVIDLKSVQRFTNLTLLTVAAFMLLTAPAFAAGAAMTPMGSVLCNVVGMVLGDIGRGLSTLAVIVVGIGATLGKVSWGMAMTVAVGIAVLFGAPEIVGYITGGGTTGCASGGMILAGGGGGGMNGNCYNTGANDAKDIMTTISCGASTLGDVTGGIGAVNDLFNGSGATANGGLLGNPR